MKNSKQNSLTEFQPELLENSEQIKLILLLKVETLWESHILWKNIPPALKTQMFLLNSVKTSGRFYEIFEAFSEKLDFTCDTLSSSEL